MSDQVQLTIIEDYFKNTEIPKEIRLNEYSVITDTKKYIDSQLVILKTHPKNSAFTAYYERLLALYNYCQTNQFKKHGETEI
jgi:hypothetical protein